MWIFKEVSVENETAHWSHGKMFGAVFWIMAGYVCGNVDIEDDCLEAIGCVDSVWYFRPCFDTKDAVQRSHWKGFPSTCIAEDNWGGVTPLCALKWLRDVSEQKYVGSNWLYLFGFSPLCVFKWLFKWPAWNDVNHTGHIFLAFPHCVFKCVLKISTLEDAKSHWLHMFEFSPLCVFKCTLKLLA